MLDSVAMPRSLILCAVLFLLCCVFLGAVFEFFDHWDGFPRSGNDIVLTFTCVALCLGLNLASALLTIAILRARAWKIASLFHKFNVLPVDALHIPPAFLTSLLLSLRI